MFTSLSNTIGRPRRSVRPQRQRHSDAGLTLVEILVGMVITGMIVSTMTFAFAAFLRSFPETVDRVAISKDVTFVQAWLPIDLASATSIDTAPVLQPATSDTLPGTNVLLITRKDLQTAGHPEFLVNYRYVLSQGEYVLVRFEIRNPGSTDPSNPEEIRQVGVAHQLAQPTPADNWDPTLTPEFAIDVTGRNPGRLRKVGSDVTVKFSDGTSYETGGAGLGPGSILTAVSGDGFVNPTSPPSRCGGRISLVLDTSSSLHAQLPQVKQAAKDFVDAFQGTPTELRIVEFDQIGKAVAPQDESASAPSPYPSNTGSPAGWDYPAIDMLNLTSAGATAVKDLIDDLDTQTGGTNWEAGLRIGMTDNNDLVAINPSPHLPDTLVFFTDGEPYRAVNNSGNQYSTSQSTAVSEAKTVSNKKGEWGITIKGVFVNNGGQSGTRLEEAKDRMKEVVGPTEWVPGPDDASGNATVGNADAAEFFYTTDFAELSNIFQQIFVSDCGGTITVQRRENSDPTDPVSTGSYEYTTTTGVGTLKAAEANSITFDYDLDTGSTAWIPLHESSASGDDIVDVKCFHNGNDVTASRVRALNDTNPVTGVDDVPVPSGREVEVRANEALSCLFIGA